MLRRFMYRFSGLTPCSLVAEYHRIRGTHLVFREVVTKEEKTMRKQTELNRQNRWATPEVNMHLAI